MVSHKPRTLDNGVERTSIVPHHRTSVEHDNGELQKLESERIKQFIQNITVDLRDLEQFYNISFSHTRVQRLGEYVVQRNNESVVGFTFEDFDPEGKVDYLLIRSYLRRHREKLQSKWTQINEMSPLLVPLTAGLVGLCENRQKVVPFDPKDAANVLSKSMKVMSNLRRDVIDGKFRTTVSKSTAYQAANALVELLSHLYEWFGFYNDYDPMFTWWVSQEWKIFPGKMNDLVATIREHLVGTGKDEGDDIVGEPSGRQSILDDLQSEMIPYSPEEIIEIGEKEYQWCEKEVIKASCELGYGNDWKGALEHVKNLYVEPGKQTYMVHELAEEAVEYVARHDLVTIPKIANECWRTFMMSSERQKVNPFFLGGDSIQVSYPTSTMSHNDKLMIMRGNSRPLSRSTVFHELLPGHHLQFYYMDRYRPYRRMFMTPFWTEGWAFYWEMILWDRDFPGTPENKIGMLFWRMHRCARIVFSIKFHLGQMEPQECIDYLVEKVGHEQATAEGEVRRSFNGDYTPLYQAGYMLGALQLYALRQDMVDSGKMREKEFHDSVLMENNMPIEMVRALLMGERLTEDHKPCWRFYRGSHS